MAEPFIQFQTKVSQPVAVGNRQLILRTRVLQIRFPGSTGGLVWNRPLSASIVGPDGRGRRLPVRDVTRLVELLLAGIIGALIFAIVARQ